MRQWILVEERSLEVVANRRDRDPGLEWSIKFRECLPLGSNSNSSNSPLPSRRFIATLSAIAGRHSDES